MMPPNFIEKFLNMTLIDNKFIFINYWSFIHLFTGGILALWIEKWYIMVGILVIYEIFEILLRNILFRKELGMDIIYDIIFGMAGWAIIRYFL